MTRTEAMTIISATLPTLDDEHLASMAELAKWWAGPSVYSTLSGSHRAQIDEALVRLDAGQKLPAETVFSDIAAKLKAAGV